MRIVSQVPLKRRAPLVAVTMPQRVLSSELWGVE